MENTVYLYARSCGYSMSAGRIGPFECDFIVRNRQMDYSYIQVAYTIYNPSDREAEDKLQNREYRPFAAIPDGYSKHLMTTDYLFRKETASSM